MKAEVPHVRPSYLLHTAGASLYPGHLHLLLHRLAGLAALCQQLVVLTSRQERLIWFRKPSRQQAVSYKNQKEISDWYHGPYWPYSLQTGQQWFLSIMQGVKHIIFQIQINSAAATVSHSGFFCGAGRDFLPMILVEITFIRALRLDCMRQPFLVKKQWWKNASRRNTGRGEQPTRWL